MTKKQDYTLPGIAAMVVLTSFVMFLGWQIAHTINPPTAGDKTRTIGASAHRQYLVFRSYRVLSRGEQDEPNDDTVEFEFFRYPLDGSALHSESIVRINRQRLDDGAGTPWMKRVSDNILLFARRDNDATTASWIDVSGKQLRTTDNEEADIIWNSLPSPDGHLTSYFNWTTGRIVIIKDQNLPLEYDLGIEQALVPVAWDEQSVNLYIKVAAEGGLPQAGLWRLNTSTGEAQEITAVRELSLYDFDIDTSAGLLVGATFTCTNQEDCGTGPSSLHLVNLNTGELIELFADDHLAFGHPSISPDAKQVAYTLSNGQSDIWISDLDVAGLDRRIISGKVLDWIADGQWLVADRDNEVQLVSIVDGTKTTVARRAGQYPDADFHGIDYIGIISKN
ncbi:MAG: hypothetical protein V1738_04750 [Patescibacteria group bacterium]